jgi:hypothetical protein
MKSWFEDTLFVLINSPKSYWAFMLGMVFFIAIIELGEYMTQDFESYSYRVLRHYDKAAVVSLISFWSLSCRLYLKDRKRILG